MPMLDEIYKKGKEFHITFKTKLQVTWGICSHDF